MRARISRARMESSSGDSFRMSEGRLIESRILAMAARLGSAGAAVLPAPTLVRGGGVEIFRLQVPFVVLEKDLDLALGLVQLAAQEPGHLDALLEQGQRFVERDAAFLELGHDLLEVGQGFLKSQVCSEPSFRKRDSRSFFLSTLSTRALHSPLKNETRTVSERKS